jgi:large subunit ribosomal protein L35Ae
MSKAPKEKQTVEIKIKKPVTGKPPRLYVKATFSGYRRGKSVQNENIVLVKIEGLNSKKEAHYYLGKRLVYIYKTKRGYKSIWGRIMSQHGNNGLVKARFLKNLPPKGIGSTLRVMLYPQRNNVVA